MSADLPLPRVPQVGTPDRRDPSQIRPGADPCYKCSTCDTVCPVLPADEEFPGPKFQGPEQWRLADGQPLIDPSIEACSNCLRCHAACPEDVSLATMHNVARERHATERNTSKKRVRNWLLANYGRLARWGSKTPRLTNWLLGNRVLRQLGERLLGITAEREAPAFATETFLEWWDERGGAHVSSEDKRVAYFHGDYANYHTPAVGKALVLVYEAMGYEVRVPDQRCSGTPMFANGHLDAAEDAARYNIARLRELVESGYDVVATCTSCSLAIREEYPALFDVEGADEVSAHTFDAVEYLRTNEDLEETLSADPAGSEPRPETLLYHAPCHAKNQGIDGQSIPLLEADGNAEVVDLGDSCSGMSGTYGWKAERYETSMEIGADMFDEMAAVDGDLGLTECPTCAMQMEHGTDYEVVHPIQLLARVIG